MSKTAEKYRVRATAMTEKIENVSEDAWGNQSPCEEWTARDVVGHLVTTTGMFFGFIGREAPSGPAVDDDPVAAWKVARDAMQAALDDPETAAMEYDGLFGPTTFESSVDRFICADLVMHNWDLSRATGQDEKLDPHAMIEIRSELEPYAEAMRSPGAFGPEIEPPEGADDQARFLCFIGRQP